MKISELQVNMLFSRFICVLILLSPAAFLACEDQRTQTVRWTEFEPVYMSHEEFLDAVRMENPRDLEKPGKIYFHNGYLFVNEINKGVHIIDNRDPSNPAIIGFIEIPANKDIAVRGDLLYADSHGDLLVFDISDMESAKLVSRTSDVFHSSARHHPGFPYRPVDHSRGIVVDWKPVEMEEICEVDCQDMHTTRFFPGFGPRTFATDSGTARPQTDGAGGASGGTGGSMARFAIAGEFLYTVDHRNLVTFDISSPEPVKRHHQNVGWMIETIFPYENHLYIGSANALYIYDISHPDQPKQVSVYWHLTACDPVVVEGDFAYVTLRDGQACRQGVNRLEVINIKDRLNPKKVAFYDMINPHGLGIDNGRLFISEGDAGLKIMDAGDPLNIKELRHIKEIMTYDVIPFNEVLMVTGGSGIVQYDYSDIHDLRHLSTIPVIKSGD